MLLLQRALITYAHYSQLHHCDQIDANTFQNIYSKTVLDQLRNLPTLTKSFSNLTKHKLLFTLWSS